jgi:hypothetical protein
VRIIAFVVAGFMTLLALPLVAAQSSPARSLAWEIEEGLYFAGNALGMLRTINEVDRVSSINYTGDGTALVGGKPCTLATYKASVNYLRFSGMRVDFTCQGSPARYIHVVSGDYAWNEEEPGVGAEPAPDALRERQLLLYMLPHGVHKAATAAGRELNLSKEGAAMIWTFPLGEVGDKTKVKFGGTMRVTLDRDYRPARVEAKVGSLAMDATYSEYGDWNGDDYLSDVMFPRRIVLRRNGTEVLNLTVAKTNTYNPYVVMPVPASLKK